MMDAALRRRRALWPAAVAMTLVAGLLLVPPLLPLTAAAVPAFPSTVGSYSWWTTPLAAGEIERATIVYQNGVGVEFLDDPQGVVLGDDGSTYRRWSIAEGLSTAEHQGDPARSLLGPDGTFVVVGSGTAIGQLFVVDLASLRSRALSVGDGVTAVPQGITADGGTVLLLLGSGPMSRYADANFELDASLATIDLATGRLRQHPSLVGVNAAAIAPDGSTALVDRGRTLSLVDLATGDEREVRGLGPGFVVGGSAFSPSGQRIAVTTGTTVRVLATDAEDAPTALPTPPFEYTSVVGWRDDDTILVQGVTDAGANTSALAWLDTATGDLDVFSTYTPDGTGAAMWVTSVASALLPDWTIADRPDDRGMLQVAVGLILAILAGVVVWLLTPRRRVRVSTPAAIAEEAPRDAERAASVH